MRTLILAEVLAESDAQLMDPMWAQMLIFAGVVLVLAAAVAVWALATPERPPRNTNDATGQIVRRAEDRTKDVRHQLEDETGRSDPAVRWTH